MPSQGEGFCCCQTPRAIAKMELTLFSPCHMKNPHQNLSEESNLQVWNCTHELNFMKVDL